MKHYYFKFESEVSDLTPVENVTGQPIFERTAPVVSPGLFRIPKSGPGSIETLFHLAEGAAMRGEDYQAIIDIIHPRNLAYIV